MERELVVVGYIGATRQGNVVCDGPACLVAGSYKTMKEYIARSTSKPPGKIKISRTRFGEVFSGMRLGGVYAFDKESYARFLPLAREEGLKLEDADFTPDESDQVKFLSIFPE